MANHLKYVTFHRDPDGIVIDVDVDGVTHPLRLGTGGAIGRTTDGYVELLRRRMVRYIDETGYEVVDDRTAEQLVRIAAGNITPTERDDSHH